MAHARLIDERSRVPASIFLTGHTDPLLRFSLTNMLGDVYVTQITDCLAITTEPQPRRRATTQLSIPTKRNKR